MAGRAERPDDLLKTLATHDAAIATLGGRLSGVETSMHKLQGEVHTGFAALGSKLDRIDSRPTFNPHEMVRTVLSVAVLFTMVVSGIVWVTTGQFGGIVAEQRAYNAGVTEKLKEHSEVLRALGDRIQWVSRVEPARK
jgi:hypothetical protein